MPTDVSALQLVLTADPALIAIVRLSLIVSLSAGASGHPHRRSLRRFSRARPLPWAGGGHRRAQRPHGVAAGGRGNGDLPGTIALGPAWVMGAVVHTTGHGHRTNDSGRSHRCCADAPDHRGLVDRVSGRANGDAYRPGR